MTADFTARITEILREHFSEYIGGSCLCGAEFDNYVEYNAHLAPLIAEAAEEHYRPVIESREHLMELLDKHGHEIVVLDAHNGAWQTYYDVDDGAYPGILLWSPEAGE